MYFNFSFDKVKKIIYPCSLFLSKIKICDIILISKLRMLSPDDACEGNTDGWGEQACAVALTVGLIFWLLFHYREK